MELPRLLPQMMRLLTVRRKRKTRRRRKREAKVVKQTLVKW